MDPYIHLLQCPRCKKSPLVKMEAKGSYVCASPDCEAQKHGYEIIDNQPILINFENSIFRKEAFEVSKGKVISRRKSQAARLVSKILWGTSPHTERQLLHLNRLLEDIDAPKVLVVGGGTIGSGTEKLYRNKTIDIISFDVYLSENCLFVADAHSIPLRSECVDCVIVQAVLEHVLAPEQVVAEIHRVLKPKGFVYAETPFMQQIHEGAYDFTRYSESGHRWLFRHFELISSGYVRGIGVSLIWAIKYFVAGISRSKTLGTIAAALFFWLRFVEKLAPTGANIDGGSGFYFLGRKSEGPITPKEITDFYYRTKMEET